MTGCGQIAESRYNPMNWFGRAQPVVSGDQTPGTLPSIVPASFLARNADARPLVPTVTNLEVLRGASGGILRASGQTATAGYYNAELVLVAIENGVATYDFRVQAPAQPLSGQTGITVAEPLTNTELNGIRQFIVRGAGNSLTVRR